MKQSTFLRKALRALDAQGWVITGVSYDMGHNPEPCTTVSAAIEAAKATDDNVIIVERDGVEAWLRVVWQGPDETYEDGDEIIADYSTKLSPVLDDVYASADRQ